MPEEDARRKLADRAHEIWLADPTQGYADAIGRALAETNPTANPDVARVLIYTLLNVNEPPPVAQRHQIPDDYDSNTATQAAQQKA